MALERTIQSWVRRASSVDSDLPGGEVSSLRQSPSKFWNRGEPSRSDWAQLLEQASDLNDELCREKCELQREAAVLRERKLRRESRRDAEGQSRRNCLGARGVEILPRVMSHVRRALDEIEHKELGVEGLSVAIEEAISRVLAAAAADSGAEVLQVASNEETAALIQEKVQLKEESLLNQERIFELELAREKLNQGGNQGHGVFRLLNNALQGHGTLNVAESAAPSGPADGTVAGIAERPAESSSAVVDAEYEVVGRKGAILRESEDLESEKVATLPPGSRVRVLEVGSNDIRRARVCTLAVSQGVGPAEQSPEQVDLVAGTEFAEAGAPSGWLSVITRDGKALLRPVVAHEEAPLAPETGDAAPSRSGEASPPPEGAAAASTGAEMTEAPMGAATSVEVAGEETSAPSTEAGQSASAPRTTETVSTDAWLSLRNERNLREQQIKALEAEVASAQRELEQLAEVRARLREQRAVALETRRRGNELHEAALMAAEELRSLRVAGMKESSSCATADEAAEPSPTDLEAEENARPLLQAEQFAVPVPGALGSCSGPATDDPAPTAPSSPKRSSSNSPEKDEEAEVRRRALEWRRLLSERETTARELGNVLQRVEDLEEALEDRRIELQAAEKRRERERRSLLTALREHDWNGGFEEEESNVRDTEAVQSPTAQTLSPEATTSAWYLQRISELEDQVDMFRKKLEDVQAREAVLNEHAVVRMKALRYAASAHGRSVDAVLAAIDNEQPGEARQRRRGDLGGLAELLEDLFVENFALRGQALIRMSGIGSARTSRRPSMFSSQVSDTAEVSGAGTADSLDLSGFVRNPDDAASDDSVEESDGIVAFGAGAHAAATSSGIEAEPAAEAPPLTPRNSEYWPDSPRSLPSPRLHMLSAEDQHQHQHQHQHQATMHMDS